MAPRLYKVLRLDGLKKVPPMDDPVNGSLNVSFLRRIGRHVRIALFQDHPAQECASVLNFTPNVEDLSLWLIKGKLKRLYPILKALPLRRLSCDLQAVFGRSANRTHNLPFDQPPFRNLTHLESINSVEVTSALLNLPLIANLTHLSVNGPLGVGTMTTLLKSCPKLQVLVWLFHDIGAGPETIRDIRLVLVNLHRDLLDGWEIAARGGVSLWRIAEMVIAARQRKEIEEKDWTLEYSEDYYDPRRVTTSKDAAADVANEDILDSS